jgi:hypothetical protein
MDSIKHTLEECDLIKCYFKGDYKATSMGAPSGSAGGEGNRDVYLDPKGCLMIISGPGDAIPAFLKWLETAITFDRKDHPDHIM